MDASDRLRYEVAMHPEVVRALEHLSDTLLAAASGAVTEAVAGALPLGELLKPLVAGVVRAAQERIAADIDHALEGLVQAQPMSESDRLAGKAGLISIEEVDQR